MWLSPACSLALAGARPALISRSGSPWPTSESARARHRSAESSRGQRIVAGQHRPPLTPVGRCLKVADRDPLAVRPSGPARHDSPLRSPPPWLAPGPDPLTRMRPMTCVSRYVSIAQLTPSGGSLTGSIAQLTRWRCSEEGESWAGLGWSFQAFGPAGRGGGSRKRLPGRAE
jgi:hypothetical protein